MFEIVLRRRRTTDDGRRLDGYTISSPCEPNGSGELKTKKKQEELFKDICNFISSKLEKLNVLFWSLSENIMIPLVAGVGASCPGQFILPPPGY